MGLALVKGKKIPIPVSLLSMPRWNESGVHGKMAQSRGRVAFRWESKFSTAQEEQSAWKKPQEAGNSCLGVLHALSQ